LITGVTVSTDISQYSSFNINSIVNGSGLPGNTPSLTGNHAAPDDSSWLGFLNSGSLITFNLNGTYSLAGFSLWNIGSQNTTIGVNGVNVLTSTDGATFNPVIGSPNQFAIGDNAATESPEQSSFAPVNASYVRFQVLSNYGNSTLVGLSEVQFNSAPASASAVPEPVTIFGTLMGLGGGAALKRRLKGVKSKSA
jgi:F5/8 type C domain